MSPHRVRRPRLASGRRSPRAASRGFHHGLLVRGRLLLAAVLLAPFLVYLPHLQKGFVSEDFLLIALHREHPPWSDLAATLGGPWLGMRLFEFYRPLAALAFGAEAALFGAQSLGYNVVHLVVHLVATGLLLGVLRALLRPLATDLGVWPVDLAAAAGAVFFGLYPLAPNSVLFVASFANLFGAAATLGATLLYLRWQERASLEDAGPQARVPLAALIVFIVAIGCYESSVALPLWLCLVEAVRLPWTRQGLSRAAQALAPFVLVAAGYMAFRVSLFGDPLGGYSEVADRLRDLDPAMALLALRSLLRLPAPWFEAQPAPLLEGLATIAAGLGAWWWLAVAPPRARRALMRLLLLAIGWILAFLAPFSFQLVSPANGRYWYLGAAGAAVGLAALLARAALVRRPLHRRVALGLSALLLAVLLGRNVVQLHRHLGWMEEAAQIAQEISNEIVRLAGDQPLFVTDHPTFVRSSRGVHLAQVYHYGLRAAVGPPFHDREIDVYPLPPRAEADPRRLALTHPVFRWDPQQARLTRIRPRSSALPRLLAVEGPGEHAVVVPEDRRTLQVVLPAGVPARAVSVRLVAVTPGNATVAPAPELTSTLELPGPFARLWSGLAAGPQLWWVEAWDEQARAVASSEPTWMRVAPSS
jgi:hypothetical protein